MAKQKHVDYLLRVSLAAVGHGALGDGGVRGAARGGGLARYEYECQRLAANRQPPALRAGESSARAEYRLSRHIPTYRYVAFRQTEAASRTGSASKNQFTWAKYEKDWAAVGKSYEPLRYPDGSSFEPENDLHPLRLCGVIGKGRDCEYLILNSEEWLHLCLRHLQQKDKTDFLYHQYGVVDGDDDHEDEEEEVEEDEEGEEEEVEAVVEAMAAEARRLNWTEAISRA